MSQTLGSLLITLHSADLAKTAGSVPHMLISPWLQPAWWHPEHWLEMATDETEMPLFVHKCLTVSWGWLPPTVSEG